MERSVELEKRTSSSHPFMHFHMVYQTRVVCFTYLPPFRILYVDLAFIQYSSGSTQECKGVMITFGALQAAIIIMEYYVNQVHHVFQEIDSFVLIYHSPCSTYSIALLESVCHSHGFPISMTWVSWECLVNLL